MTRTHILTGSPGWEFLSCPRVLGMVGIQLKRKWFKRGEEDVFHSSITLCRENVMKVWTIPKQNQVIPKKRINRK